MPGIAMDGADANGTIDAPASQNDDCRGPPVVLPDGSLGHFFPERNGSHGFNVALQEPNETCHPADADLFRDADGVRASVDSSNKTPPDLVHITHGFFPFARLINRAIQQCWIELMDIVTEFAGSPLRMQDTSTTLAETNNNAMHGKTDRSRSDELLRRKILLLEFAQAKRAEFIKLLVLSNWGRRAAEVSRLIDLQAFIRMRYDSYNDVLALSAMMKSGLIRAQMANPDLKTSLEVLSDGKVGRIPMVRCIILLLLLPKLTVL